MHTMAGKTRHILAKKAKENIHQKDKGVAHHGILSNNKFSEETQA